MVGRGGRGRVASEGSVAHQPAERPQHQHQLFVAFANFQLAKGAQAQGEGLELTAPSSDLSHGFFHYVYVYICLYLLIYILISFTHFNFVYYHLFTLYSW